MAPTRSTRNAEYRLYEFGVLALLVGLLVVAAPHVLRGSNGVNAVLRSLQPLGWASAMTGLGLFAAYRWMRHARRQALARSASEASPEGRASRFQHSVLPEELLNPPSRIRLDPLSIPVPTEPSKLEHPTLPSVLDSTPREEVASSVHPRASAWGADVLAAIEWRRFEAVCEALFSQAGFEPRSEPGGGQRATVMWLHSRHAKGPVAVACCRHWLHRPLGIVDLEPLRLAMENYQLKRGTCVTSGGYTRKALEYAHHHGINLLDGPALLALIGRRRPEQQQALLDIAYEGEFWRPTCAACGSKMVQRSTTERGPSFWGCMAYPRCRHTLPLAT